MENHASSPTLPKSDKGSRRWTLIWMIISQVLSLTLIAGPVLFVWLGVQEGGSLPLNIGTFMFLAPTLNIILIVAAWVTFSRQKTRQALILTTLPLVISCLEVASLVGMMLGIIPTP